jgi:hypothetical protein
MVEMTPKLAEGVRNIDPEKLLSLGYADRAGITYSTL